MLFMLKCLGMKCTDTCKLLLNALNIRCVVIHNSQNVEAIQVSINR